MKKIFYIICCLGIVVLLSACQSDDNSLGTSGDSGVDDVRWTTIEGDIFSTCYDADKNVINNPWQYCEWNCADYDGTVGNVKVSFYYGTEADVNPTDEDADDTTLILWVMSIVLGDCI